MVFPCGYQMRTLACLVFLSCAARRSLVVMVCIGAANLAEVGRVKESVPLAEPEARDFALPREAQ